MSSTSELSGRSQAQVCAEPFRDVIAATRNSAHFLGLDQHSMVASGKNADFLVLDANPLDNIAKMRRISRVYLRGAEVDRTALRTQLIGGPAATRPHSPARLDA